jgi:hypothetical protein
MVFCLAACVTLFDPGHAFAVIVDGSDIPGAVEVTQSPVTGSLNDISDDTDVFKVWVPAGSELTLSLSGPSGTDFDLYVYDPTAVSIWDDYINGAEGWTYPDEVTVAADVSGFYPVAIYAFEGAGTYSVNWSIQEADSDIEYAIEATGSPLAGSLDQSKDTHDVYKVWLAAGEAMLVSLEATQGTDFDVLVFGPTASSIMSTPLVWSRTSTYPESVSCVAQQSGWYYLDIAAGYRCGSGDYEVSWVRDSAAPTVGFSVASYSVVGDWEHVSIVATDPGGVGVSTLSYRLNDAAVVTTHAATASVVPVGYGSNRIEAWATDRAGKSSEPQVVYVRAETRVRYDLAFSDPRPIWGTHVLARCALRSAGPDGRLLPGRVVAFESHQGGGRWINQGTRVTDAQGVATLDVYSQALQNANEWRVRLVEGRDANYGCASSVSPTVTIMQRPRMGVPVAPERVKPGAAFKVGGYFYPYQRVGSKLTRINRWRWDGREWVWRGYVVGAVPLRPGDTNRYPSNCRY